MSDVAKMRRCAPHLFYSVSARRFAPCRNRIKQVRSAATHFSYIRHGSLKALDCERRQIQLWLLAQSQFGDQCPGVRAELEARGAMPSSQENVLNSRHTAQNWQAIGRGRAQTDADFVYA